MNVSSVLNGWIAAAGGIAVVLTIGVITQRWHEMQVRKALKDLVRGQKAILTELQGWKKRRH